ncbi:MAG: hypothetical protein V1821_02220, partial [bacterium]
MRLPKSILLLMGFSVILAALPVLLNIFVAGQHFYPERAMLVAAPDTPVYENYLYQVKHGAVVLWDQMSTEKQTIPILNIFWLLLGLVGRLLGTKPEDTFLIGKIACAALVPVGLYWFSKFYCADRATRVETTYFLSFVSGLGYLVYYLSGELSDDFL